MKRRTLLGCCSVGALSGCIQFSQGQSNDTSQSGGVATWKFEADAPLTSPVTTSNTIIVGTLNQTVYALNRATGEQVWTVGPDNFSSSELIMGDPFLIENSVIAHTNQDIVKIDANTGEIQAAMKDQFGAAYSTVTAEMMVAAGNGDGLTAYENVGGPEMWQSSISSGYGWTFAPVIGDEIVVFATVSDYVDAPDAERTKDTRVFALEKESGEKRWHFTPDEFIGRSVGVAYTMHGDIVVVVDNEGVIYGLSVSDGSVMWSDEIERRGSGTSAPQPFIRNDNFWVVSGDIVSKSVSTGETKWTVSPEAIHLTSNPPVTQSTTWVPTGDFFEPTGVTSIAHEGTIMDTYTLSEPFERLAVSDTSLFVGHSDDVLRVYTNLDRLN